MTNKLVVFKLGEGSFEQGFPVTLQIGEDGDRPETEITGKLPPAPEIPQLYNNWQLTYRRLGFPYRLGKRTAPTNVNLVDECNNAASLLHNSLKNWLGHESFRSLREKLLAKLFPSDEIRVLVQTKNKQLQQLPWHLWDLFEHYPSAELSLSAPAYERVDESKPHKAKVKILAILGNSVGIDIEADRTMLQELPDAEICFLVEPQRIELTDKLWEQSWDILFFAGHSLSEGETGRIYINQTDSLTIEQLKYGLRKAVKHGLKLAIFNSCDGLGLARELADLRIPQVIVMREPVPDRVAHEFLKYFLTGFAGGKSLYITVREARERLQGLEGQFPFATWLPVIWQNPAMIPPTWEELSGKRQKKPAPESTWGGLQKILLASVAITSLLLGVRWLGMLQPFELWAFDRLIRLRPKEDPDSRLLVITISEADIQAQNQEERRGSLSDAALTKLLAKLEPYQPRAIGLDVYRDFPVRPEYQNLATNLRQNDRFIAVCKSKDSENDPYGIPPPPEVPEARLGFSDFVEDDDGVLRRQLLFITPEPASPCNATYGFAVQLALLYLYEEGIQANFTPEGNFQLGTTVFQRLKPRTGGYQPVDAGGNQVLLNYRSLATPDKIAPQVTLTEVLSGKINPNAVKDKVILIGTTATSSGDRWETPYGSGPSGKIPGVFLQGQMVSQILSAVLDERPLLWVLPLWGEVIWVWGWCAIGGLIVWRNYNFIRLVVKGSITIIALSGFCFVLSIQGGWVPLVPSILGLAAMVARGSVAYLRMGLQKSSTSVT